VKKANLETWEPISEVVILAIIDSLGISYAWFLKENRNGKRFLRVASEI
jgi:hypothetical protein